MSERFLNALEQDYYKICYFSGGEAGAGTARKDSKEMTQNSKKLNIQTGGRSQISRKAAEKKKRTIIVSAVAAVLVIVILASIVIAARKTSGSGTTRTTTYSVDEISYGSVSTTISGSGTLIPVTKETLTAIDLLSEGTSDDEENGDPAASEDDAAAYSALPDTDAGSADAPVIAGGTVQSLNFSVGDTVEMGDILAVVVLEDESTVDIIAPYDAVLLECYLHEGDIVSDSTSVAMFMGTDGYTMNISVDELNISSVALDQEVNITIDAVGGDYTGAVTDISYNGSTSGSTAAYQIEVAFDYVEGTYPGMSVAAEIVIEDSGDGLLVPVDAVYTSGDTNYVYLAPNGVSLGDAYDGEELDTSKLTKITVETGMSDGTYIIIESDELEEGDLIVATTITSSLTGSDSSGSGGMGSFPGGSLPDGLDFGDFDFGDFDPSQFGGSFPFGN